MKALVSILAISVLVACASIADGPIEKSAEFQGFLSKIRARWEEKITTMAFYPKEDTTVVVVLAPGKGRKLEVKRADSVSAEASRLATEVVEAEAASTAFSPPLFARLRLAKEVKCEFRYHRWRNSPTRHLR
jgi:hypothetical protein